MTNIRILSRALLLTSVCFAFQAHADVSTPTADYLQVNTSIVKQMTILKANAGSCGFVGGQIADAMTDALKGEQKQIADFSNAVSKGKAGKATLQAQLADAIKSNKEMESNLGMARYGLSTDSPTCKKASAAFETMRNLSLSIPKKLQAIISAL